MAPLYAVALAVSTDAEDYKCAKAKTTSFMFVINAYSTIGLRGYPRPDAGVAQLVEHLSCKQVARGSSPLSGSGAVV